MQFCSAFWAEVPQPWIAALYLVDVGVLVPKKILNLFRKHLNSWCFSLRSRFWHSGAKKITKILIKKTGLPSQLQMSKLINEFTFHVIFPQIRLPFCDLPSFAQIVKDYYCSGVQILENCLYLSSTYDVFGFLEMLFLWAITSSIILDFFLCWVQIFPIALKTILSCHINNFTVDILLAGFFSRLLKSTQTFSGSCQAILCQKSSYNTG